MSSCTAPPAQDVSRVADPDLATLVEIVGSQRLIEPRITGGFSFGAWQPQRRAPNADWRLVAIAGRVRHQRPGSDLDAVITLLGGDHDAAIRLLERPGDNPARAPHRLSDLAAARLARWRSEGRAFDAVRALDDVGRAIALRPDLDEAWFNRALALEAVGLSRSARRAWRQYVQRHPQSPWAAEARQRADADDEQATDGAARDPRQQLTQLIEAGDWPGVSRLVQRFPQHAREYLEDRLFAEQASGSDHSQLVDTVGRLGRLLHERHHESQWRLIGEELRGLTVTDWSRLATTLIDLQKARKAIDANQFDRAAQLLEPLPNRLPDAPGLSATARFWRVYVRWHRADRAAVLAEIAALQKEFARRHLKYLGARLSLMQAASLESLVRYSAAGDAFATAIRAFTTLGEDEFGASAEAMLANLLAIQGDLPGAWEHQRLALTALDRITSARRQVVVLANAVVLSTRHPVRYAALELQEELIAAARAWGDAGAVTRYHIERARLLNGLTRTADANGALQAARASLEAIADASNRRLFELDLQIEEARALIEPSPERAAALLADAIRRMPAAAGEARLAEAYLDLGRARQRAGRGEEALADWVSGIDLFERHRSQVQGEQLRISFFSRAWELYTEAVSEAVRQQQHDKALALVERSRARTLRDALGKPSSPLARDGVSPFQRPANGTVIVEFASVRDAVLAWCITARGRTFARLSWSSTEFERQIQLVRDELLNGGGTDRTRQLSSVLLGSCANDLRASSHLIVIPDGVISSVPFASLTFPDDHEPLLERLTVTLAPSLSLIQSAPSATAQALAAPGSAVFLGDPAFDARSYPGLPRLADARREVHDSAEIYPSPVVLSGAQATAVALKRSIGTADVVHFAGHAVGDDEFPFRAVLLLAPADGDPGTLRADDLSGLRAGRTRLVILSGCSTATGSAAFGEGVLSLARPFLAAGVPSVLGTLWDLDDRAAAALLPRFHRGIREGLRPAEALRRAQLSLLHGNDEGLRSPRAWAGFVLIGGA